MLGLTSPLPSLLGNRFEPERVLREGFVASTWLARDLETGGLAILKVLHGDMRRERVVASWFEDQARALARLDHPNVVPLLYDGTSEDPPFFATAYMPGGSVDEVLASGRRLSPRRAVQIALDALAGLQHAHERGILHGALKPGNLLIDESGRACLTDFAPGREELRHVTMVGVTAGSSMYLAPEQGAIPMPTSAATDVYALGAILVHLLVGSGPIALLGPDRDAELARLPAPLRPVLDRATKPDLAARYPTAEAFAADLKTALRQLP